MSAHPESVSRGHNILMVLSVKTFPPDGRVEREARDLIRDGHRVFLMARRGIGQTRTETVDGVHVIRAPLPFQKRKAIADFIHLALQRYYILFHIISACRRYNIDALHVHDLPYAFATALAGRLLGIPVVFDMHEHYTAMLKTGMESFPLLKPFFAILLMLMRIEERIACRWARKVIVVADEHIPRIESLGVRRENIVVVTNTEDVDHFTGLPLEPGLVERFRDEFVILYFGGFAAHRGIETAIDAMPAILEQIPNARLLLVGDGYSLKAMEKMAAESPCAGRITFIGHQPFAKLPTFIGRCEVCLIPHISTPHIDTTMPNKIFQAMMLACPVVVSSTRPMMRIVADAQCGLVFTERDPRSLAETVCQLRDPELRRQLGENGKRAVLDRYNWQQTVKALLELYRPTANGRDPRTP